MVDPVTLGTLAVSAAMGAGSTAAMGLMSKGDAPAVPAAPSAPTPAQAPGKKPAAPGMQQSFLSGVAGSMLPGSQSATGNPTGGGQTGKTLLGA